MIHIDPSIKTDTAEIMYVPIIYNCALSDILDANDIRYTKTRLAKPQPDSPDTYDREQWAKRFEISMNRMYINPRRVRLFEIYADTEKLFDIFIDALHNDDDTKDRILTGSTFPYIPSEKILE